MLVMPLALNFVPTFNLEGSKAEWKVHHSELIELNGTQYVELKKGKCNHHGFPRLVYTMAELDDKDWSLTSSIGYKELQSLRNEAQRAALTSAQLEALPTWQRASAKLKPKRTSRCKLKELSEHRGVLTINVPGANGTATKAIEVITPVYSAEDIRVKLDVQTVMHVLAFIVDRGFDMDLKRQPRDPELPKGVYKRNGKYIVRLTPTADKKYKTVDTVDEAKDALEHEEEEPLSEINDRNDAVESEHGDGGGNAIDAIPELSALTSE